MLSKYPATSINSYFYKMTLANILLSLNICISPHKHPWHHPCYASSVAGSFIGGEFLGDMQSETVLPWDWQTDITGLGYIINCEDCEMWVCDSSHNLMLTCVDLSRVSMSPVLIVLTTSGLDTTHMIPGKRKAENSKNEDG